MSKKLAIVFTRFPYESEYGGEESHTLSLAEHFRKLGYEVIFLGSCKVLQAEFRGRGFPVEPCWGGKMIVTGFELIKSFFLFPLVRWKIRRHFKKLSKQYDVKALYCLSLNEKIFLTPYALKKKIPITWVEHQEIRNWLMKNPWKFLYKKYSRHVMIVPICKKNMRSLLNLGVSGKQLREIVNGVDVKTLTSLLRKTKKNLLVTANRNLPKKGISDFLKAIDLIGRNDVEVRVITDFLKKEKWYELLLEADVVVTPARDGSETFSLNTAEALAAGCKVVVTTCSGIADYLTNKKNAFLVRPCDPEDLAKGINDALASDEDIREHAMKVAREQFDQERMLESYESVILRP